MQSLKDQIVDYLDSKEVDCYQSEEDLFCDHFDLVQDDDGNYQFDNKVFTHIDQVILYNDETMNVFVDIVNQLNDN